MEQQGQIVEDCFRGETAALAVSPAIAPTRPRLNPPAQDAPSA